MALDLQKIKEETITQSAPSSSIQDAKSAVQTTTPVGTQDGIEKMFQAKGGRNVGIISSQQGQDIVRKKDEQLATLEEDRADLTDEAAMKRLEELRKQAEEIQQQIPTAEEKDSITFINPETGAEQTLRGDAITPEAQQNLEAQGFQVSEGDISKTPQNPELEILEDEYKSAERDLTDFSNRLEEQAISSKELRSTIRDIQQVYGARVDAMREINRRRQDSLRTLGVRLGSRYTGGIKGVFGGVIAEEERQGLERIQAIEAEMRDEINNAKDAARNFNYTLYSESVDRARKLMEDKREAFLELQKAQKEEQQKIKDEEELITNQSKVLEQVNLGITNPAEIFGNLGGAVPYDIITEITKSLPGEGEKEFRSGSKYQPAGVFDPATGEFTPIAGSALSAGGSAVTPTGNVVSGSGKLEFNLNEVPEDANLLTVQIGPKIYGGRISNDESKRIEDLAEKGIAANQTTAEIMDAIMGYTPSKNKEFANQMRNVLMTVTNEEDGLSSFDMVGLARLIENDNLEGAVRKVEQTVMRQARKDDPNLQMSEGTARIYARQKDDFDNLLKEMPDGLSSATAGTVDEWLGRFRKTEQTKIKNRITEMTAKLRNEMLGSAVTESEEAFLEALIPKLSDQPAAFTDKINRLAETPLIKLNEIRSQYGLPKLSQKELLDTQRRVNLYQQGVQQTLSSKSNTDLVSDMSGSSIGEPEVTSDNVWSTIGL